MTSRCGLVHKARPCSPVSGSSHSRSRSLFLTKKSLIKRPARTFLALLAPIADDQAQARYTGGTRHPTELVLQMISRYAVQCRAAGAACVPYSRSLMAVRRYPCLPHPTTLLPCRSMSAAGAVPWCTAGLCPAPPPSRTRKTSHYQDLLFTRDGRLLCNGPWSHRPVAQAHHLPRGVTVIPTILPMRPASAPRKRRSRCIHTRLSAGPRLRLRKISAWRLHASVLR